MMVYIGKEECLENYLLKSCSQICAKPQVAQAHYDSPEQHYTSWLRNYSHTKKL